MHVNVLINGHVFLVACAKSRGNTCILHIIEQLKNIYRNLMCSF